MEQQGLTRREMLGRGIAVVGAGGLAAAGFRGAAWPGDEAAAATLPASAAAPRAGSGVRHFVSRPDLTPPDVTLTHGPAATSMAGDPPYLLLTPSAGRGTPGLMILDRAGSLILSSSGMKGSEEVIRLARELNPDVRVLARASYVRELPTLRDAGAEAVFSGEGEVALAVTEAVLRDLGATPDQIDRERDRVREELFGKPPPDPPPKQPEPT